MAAWPLLIVVMGVSGCGKTSVGEDLAERLGLPFIEGDALHPAANVAKMSGGTPLTDEDRWPWLDIIGEKLAEAHRSDSGLVVTCSSLKRIYRDRMRERAGGRLVFVFLHGTLALLRERMAARRGHFMPPSLLDSQFATLEDPSAEPLVVPVDIDSDVGALVDEAVAGLARLGAATGRPASA